MVTYFFKQPHRIHLWFDVALFVHPQHIESNAHHYLLALSLIQESKMETRYSLIVCHCEEGFEGEQIPPHLEQSTEIPALSYHRIGGTCGIQF